MRKDGKILALILVFAMVMGIVPINVVKAQGNKEITIIHTNDIHGHAKSDDKERIGYPKFKTFVDQVKAKNPNTLVFDAGDVIHGTTLATISQGQSMINLMNAIGVNGMVPGNHDFNYGFPRLMELAKGAKFPILASNVVKTDGTHPFEVTKIYDVAGVKIGVFGLATPETKTKSSPLNTEGLKFEDAVTTAKAMVEKLKSEGANVIVCLSHLGLDEESTETSKKVAEQVTGIDLIIDGHSHTLLNEGLKVGSTTIVQTGEHLKNIGEVTLKLNGTKLESVTAKTIPYAQASKLTPNKAIVDLIDGIEKADAPKLNVVLGKTKTLLDGERGNVRTGETNLGDLIADAMLKRTGADVAITNGGGIRASIKPGDIKVKDVLTSFPFTNYPVLLEVKGSTIVEALNYGIDAFPESAGKFPQIAGMRITIGREAGKNIAKDITVAGKPLEMDKTYKLVTNDFMAIGGDGYTMFKAAKKLGEFPLLSEVLGDYIKTLSAGGKEIDFKADGRIQGVLFKRISGDDRVKTAIAISKDAFEKADNVVIASGENYPDALVATKFAVDKNAPILLNVGKGLSAMVTDEINRLGAKNIFIVGGVNSVDPQVEKQLKELKLEVTRISGQTRYDTAKELVKANAKTAEKVILASGEQFADAISATNLGVRNDNPILLTEKGKLPQATIDGLKDLKAKYVVLVGGTNTVNTSVEGELQKLGFATNRVHGVDRFDTSAKTANQITGEIKAAVLATGLNYPDALTAGATIHKNNGALLLVNKGLTKEQENIIKAKAIKEIVVVGGVNSVSNNAGNSAVILAN